MKKLLLIAVLTFTGIYGIITANDIKQNPNTQSSPTAVNSLDLQGTYLGIIPCADCNGIETILKLNNDLTYSLSATYRGKSTEPVKTAGKISWNAAGNTITLMSAPDEKYPSMYSVEENKLILLDRKGKRITGKFSGNYILKKNTNEITGKYWRLFEMNGKPTTLNGIPSEVNLAFRSDDYRVTGFGGCNSFVGNYLALPGNRITFSEIAITEKACLNLEAEAEFMRMLANTDNYFSNTDTLVLNKAKMAPLARFVYIYFK